MRKLHRSVKSNSARSFLFVVVTADKSRWLATASAPCADSSAAFGPTQRFTFLDALRALAATGVAAYHIGRYGPVAHAAQEAMPRWLESSLKYGWVGVQIFFVLSGFVIAYSLRATRVTPAFVAQFAVRRSLRLDPAYWTTIALVLLLSAFIPSVFADPNLEGDPVSAGQVAAHLFYLQNILGLGNISVGFWTLCIEVQFYLTLIAPVCCAMDRRRRPAGMSAGSDAPGRLACAAGLDVAVHQQPESKFG